MPSKKNYYYKTHYELLQDENYLLWRFFSSEELDEYWNCLIQEYPELQNEINLADTYLEKKFFPKKYMNVEKKEEILDDILFAIDSNKRANERKSNRVSLLFIYGIVASILLLIGVFTYQAFQFDSFEQISICQLDAESIQLHSLGITTFQDNNISIIIDEMGVASVLDINKTEKMKVLLDENSLSKLVVPFGKRITVVFPDGTKAWLNSGSTLVFPSKFENEKREIKLIGEMYIEVSENDKSPFFVETSDFKVRVLGTKFCVSAYEKHQKSVVLVEGKVELCSDVLNESFLLMPNEKALFDNNLSFSKSEVDVLEYITWTNGYIMLNDTPIEDVLCYISRYFNISFKYSNSDKLKKLTCTGKLYLSDDLNNVVKSISLLSNTSFMKKDNTIYITID